MHLAKAGLWVSLAGVAVAGCSGDSPCLTEGASRKLDCECPDGSHFEYKPASKSESWCVADDAGLVVTPNAEVRLDGRIDGANSATEIDAAGQGTVTDDARPANAASPADGGSLSAVARVDASSEASPPCVPTPELCNGRDDDCDLQVDEGVSEAPLGRDCSNGGVGACAKTGKHRCFDGAIVCDAPPPAPQLEVCDGIDNDCIDGPDNGLTNACLGSACNADLGLLGQACTVGEGDCQGVGTWKCDGMPSNTLRCDAREKPKNACGVSCGPVPREDCSTPFVDENCDGHFNEGCCTPSEEVCDGIDNNCNGQTDEAGRTWYPDCDGDGYAPSGDGSLASCTKPAAPSSCPGGWTIQPPGSGTTDCNDDSDAYRPGANFALILNTMQPQYYPHTTRYCSSGNFTAQPPFRCIEGASADFNCDGKQEPLPTNQGGVYWESSALGDPPFEQLCPADGPFCGCYLAQPAPSPNLAVTALGVACGITPYVTFYFCSPGSTSYDSTERWTAVLPCR